MRISDWSSDVCSSDLILLTKGWPTLRGSRAVSRDQPWPEDAPAVARLREHGAVLLGKTTTPEFGWKGVTDSALDGITRRSEEHTSELQSLMRSSYAVYCLKQNTDFLHSNRRSRDTV